MKYSCLVKKNTWIHFLVDIRKERHLPLPYLYQNNCTVHILDQEQIGIQYCYYLCCPGFPDLDIGSPAIYKKREKGKHICRPLCPLYSTLIIMHTRHIYHCTDVCLLSVCLFERDHVEKPLTCLPVEA